MKMDFSLEKINSETIFNCEFLWSFETEMSKRSHSNGPNWVHFGRFQQIFLKPYKIDGLRSKKKNPQFWNTNE